jgi:type II secretory pathway pseudopilin PulG
MNRSQRILSWVLRLVGILALSGIIIGGIFALILADYPRSDFGKNFLIYYFRSTREIDPSAKITAVDFAGGTVVHVNSSWTMIAILIIAVSCAFFPDRISRLIFFGTNPRSFIILIILLILILLSFFQYDSARKRATTRALLSALSVASEAYKQDFGALPGTIDNHTLYGLLSGNNSRKIVFFEFKPVPPIKNEEFVDAWDTPIRVLLQPNRTILFISAGRDKVFGTADDITVKAPDNL